MNTKILQIDYQGQGITFNADGWINATEAAARFSKEPAQWLRLRVASRNDPFYDQLAKPSANQLEFSSI